MNMTESRIASIELAIADSDSVINWALDHRDRGVFAEQCKRREDLKVKLAHLQAGTSRSSL